MSELTKNPARTYRTFCVRAYAVALAILLPSYAGHCAGVVAITGKGQIHEVGTPPDSLKALMGGFDFTARIHDNRFLIDGVFTQPTTAKSQVEKFQLGGKPGETYFKRTFESLTGAVLLEMGVTSSGIFPSHAEAYAEVIWMACVLNHLSNEVRSSAVELSRRLKFLTVNSRDWTNATVEVRANASGDIVGLDYRQSPFVWDDQGVRRELPPPYDKGLLLASMRRTAHDPKLRSSTWEYADYMMTHEPADRDDVVARWTKTVSFIETTEKADSLEHEFYLPPIHTPLEISDHRFEDKVEVPLVYIASRWLETDDPWLKERLELLIQIAGVVSNPKSNRIAVLLLLAAALLLPVLAYCGFRWRARRGNASAR